MTLAVPPSAAAVGTMTPVVAEAWHKLTVTAQTDAEARKAATNCARAVNAAGVVALKVSLLTIQESCKPAGLLLGASFMSVLEHIGCTTVQEASLPDFCCMHRPAELRAAGPHHDGVGGHHSATGARGRDARVHGGVQRRGTARGALPAAAAGHAAVPLCRQGAASLAHWFGSRLRGQHASPSMAMLAFRHVSVAMMLGMLQRAPPVVRHL
jgi:hypothetical protein